MSHQQEFKDEALQLEILQTITNVYAQIASLWMTKATQSVLTSRDYLFEVHQVFLRVFSSYVEEVQSLARKKRAFKNGKITFLAHNGKKVAVLLSANTGFYGDIIRKTFDMFIKEVREHNYEAVIVGKQGLSFFLSEEPDRPHTFFDFPDGRIDQQQVIALIRHLVQYEEIRVYHGRFQNFLVQEPVVFSISADPYSELESQHEKPKKYIFEPNIESILIFFEKQIFGSVFEQTVRESQLAKFASRLMVMDRAGENIKNKLKIIFDEERKMTHRKNNRKQQTMFASMSLWNA